MVKFRRPSTQKKSLKWLLLPAVVGLFLIALRAFFSATEMDAPLSSATSLLGNANHPKDAMLCVQNPYIQALQEPLKEIVQHMDKWLEDLPVHLEKAKSIQNWHTMQGAEKWAARNQRFFAFDASMATCSQLDCVGGACREDTSKIVCGLDQLTKEKERKCIIYSLGGNNQWEFELDALEKTPCEIHTFDCTGEESRFEKPDNDRLVFHHVCLGTEHMDKQPRGRFQGEFWTLLEAQQRLGHGQIDLFKIDIEGGEFPIFESWPLLEEHDEASRVLMPMQILIEVHMNDSLGPIGMVTLQERLLKMGYVTVERDDNQHFLRGTELTLIRVQCPTTGVYAPKTIRS